MKDDKINAFELIGPNDLFRIVEAEAGSKFSLRINNIKEVFSMSIINLDDISLALQKNAEDFLDKGLSYIIEEEKEDYKYSLLNVFSGTLLFLKDVLYKEHWSFIFQDLNQAKKSTLINNEIKSVNFTTLLNRLENLTDIKLDEKLVNDLKWMQKERNKIEHFYNSLNHHEVKSKIASLLSGLIDLIKSIHKTDDNYDMTGLSEHDYDALFELLQDYSLKFDKYITKRNNVIRNALSECYLIIKCPSCNQNAVEVDSDNTKTTCHFCLEELTFDMFFAIYSPIHFDYDSYDIIDSIGNCPNCSSNLLYETDVITCFTCQETYEVGELSECPRCDVTIVGSDGLCESCLEHVMNQ